MPPSKSKIRITIPVTLAFDLARYAQDNGMTLKNVIWDILYSYTKSKSIRIACSEVNGPPLLPSDQRD